MAANKSVLLLFLGDPETDRRIQSFARLFREAGWDVDVVAPKSSISRGPRKFIKHHRALMRALQSRRADVVVACDLYSLSAARRMKASGRAQTLLYDSREVYTELPAVTRRPLRRKIWKRVEKRGLLFTDLVIVTAPHDLQAILDVHRFVPKSQLIRNLPWKGESVVPNVEALRSYGIPPGVKTLVYLGGLQSGRGLAAVLTAMKSANVHLLLIGDGALRATIEQQARELELFARVHFAGAVASDEALRIAAACDAGIAIVEPISKSYELALPSKMFEYMSIGLPVVTNRMKHVVELFAEQPWLTYVDPNDADSIAAGIRSALDIPTETRNAEQKLALEQYHFAADAARLLQLLS